MEQEFLERLMNLDGFEIEQISRDPESRGLGHA